MLGRAARPKRRTRRAIRVGRRRPGEPRGRGGGIRGRRRYTRSGGATSSRRMDGFRRPRWECLASQVDNPVKYIIVAISAAVVLATLVFVGSGYLSTRSADRKADDLRGKVHAMTAQDLAAAIARCDATPSPDEPRGGAVRHDAAFCEDVAREVDNRPLEIVNVKPAAAPVLPR